MPQDKIEAARRREEDQRNRERLQAWWLRYCDARPLIWAIGRTIPAAAHPFRRYG